jgi:hypothetical protein
MGGFDEGWFASHWWLLFPILGFAIAFYSMWLEHRRKRDWLDLMKTYAQQGKEPPATLTNAAAAGDWNWGGSHSQYRGSRFHDVRRAIFMGVLAGAFGYLYYFRPEHNEGFGIAAVVLGALAVGFLLMSIFRPRSADLPPPRSDGR